MRVLITGAAGQDGTILASVLERESIEVFGLIKPGTDASLLRSYAPRIDIAEVDLADVQSLRGAIGRWSQHTSITSVDSRPRLRRGNTRKKSVRSMWMRSESCWKRSVRVLLTHFFQASSSHVLGNR